LQAPSGRFGSLATLVRPTLALLSVAALVACSEPSTEFAIAVDFDLETLDPHAENTYGNVVVLSNVYEPLVALDAEMRVCPALATSWETPDPLTWVFRLRPSVRFHGGETLSSADVVYSLQRVLDGTDLEMRTYLGNVAEVRARGEDAVVVRTKRPHTLLPGHLSFIQIVPRGSSAEDLSHRPNGTGPYAVETWVPRERVLLRRHSEHWGPPPALERVAFELKRSPEQALSGIETGRYQMVAEINDGRLEKAARSTGLYDTLHRDNLYVRYLGFDVQRDETPFCKSIPNPFKLKAVREAIHLALDREALTSSRQSRAVPASQFVPRAIFGFDPEIPMPAFDPGRARELLREAGLGAGFDVVLHCLDGVLEQPARAISEQLGRVGIQLLAAGHGMRHGGRDRALRELLSLPGRPRRLRNRQLRRLPQPRSRSGHRGGSDAGRPPGAAARPAAADADGHGGAALAPPLLRGRPVHHRPPLRVQPARRPSGPGGRHPPSALTVNRRSPGT